MTEEGIEDIYLPACKNELGFSYASLHGGHFLQTGTTETHANPSPASVATGVSGVMRFTDGMAYHPEHHRHIQTQIHLDPALIEHEDNIKRISL